MLVLTLFMAAASGLGGVPYFFVRSFSKEYSALASAVACGVMLAASFDLVHEGQPYGANMVILGVLIGESSHLDNFSYGTEHQHKESAVNKEHCVATSQGC